MPLFIYFTLAIELRNKGSMYWIFLKRLAQYCKPIDYPVDPNIKALTHPGRYWRLVGKLNYVTT